MSRGPVPGAPAPSFGLPSLRLDFEVLADFVADEAVAGCEHGHWQDEDGQGAAGTRVPVLHGVQTKEGIPLWVTSAVVILLTKKDAQCESCKISFKWGKMKTGVQETAPQTAPRDCPKEAVGEGQYIRFW